MRGRGRLLGGVGGVGGVTLSLKQIGSSNVLTTVKLAPFILGLHVNYAFS